MRAILKAVLFVVLCLGGASAGTAWAARCLFSPFDCIGSKSCKSYSEQPGEQPKSIDGYYIEDGQRIPVKCYLVTTSLVATCEVNTNDDYTGNCCFPPNAKVECNGYTKPIGQFDDNTHGCWVDITPCGG